ncbi:carboxypeptidase-like regulatory domain-containing protein [Priestia aryabhattai]|uniref:carboxypeptidase-like regulatory domain-containing protein n=1 Tax=Priestia aryabhattai TaxID=412384 RepID=UPI0020404A42|nr:carboxypeptidase-like regulatory domain-containing protein [Priestia aryabhattai]MCM3644883.1 carboxypeptidase-like regulatory domain-containing protein [Priestia aryabhattai]
MIKKVSLSICSFLFLSLISTVSLSVANAETTSTQNLSGNISSSISFSNEQIKEIKEAYESSVTSEETLSDLENDLQEAQTNGEEKEVESISNTIDSVQQLDIDKQFTKESDSTQNLETPLPSLQVSLDDKYTVSTDKDGNYQFNNIPEGTYSLKVSLGESVLSKQEVVINGDDQPNQTVDVELNMSGDTFYEGAQLMGEQMDMGDDTAETSTTYYPEYKVGTFKGSGRGTMKIIAKKNIVGCNKAGKSLSKDSSTFPANNSDCAVAIYRGAAYAGNRTVFSYWKNNYYCYVESVQNALSKMGESSANVYCNGKKKSSGHYNCSWFRGHSESLHTH